MLAADGADLFERLDHADFVVDAHDGDETGLVRDRVFQVVQVDEAVLLDRKVGYFEAALREPTAAVQDALVLLGIEGEERTNRLGRDDVVLLSLVELGDSLHGDVVALRGARSENDFFRRSSDQLSNLLSRLLDRLSSAPSENVCSRVRITIILSKVRKHRLEHSGIHSGRRLIVRRQI